MSWWIIDTVSINEDGDESLCDIQCDTAADLPAADQTGTAGYTIVRGSTALDLATGDRYIMDSSGSWVRQPSQYQLDLSGYATQSWVNGELAGYVPSTTYNTDQAAQDAVITDLSDHITIHSLLNSMPYTTLTSYADSLGIGVHHIFVQNGNFLTDVPFNNSSAFVTVMAFSVNTAVMEFTPASTTYQMYRYGQVKTSGIWRGWYRFEGVSI